MKIIRPLTPLRQRMLEDMQIRNYSPYTIDGYLRYVAQFAKHFHTSPDRLDAEHIRTYQLHLLQQQVSKSIFIQTVCALLCFVRYLCPSGGFMCQMTAMHIGIDAHHHTDMHRAHGTAPPL
jgi:site-specific recombinase XerD